MTGEEQTFKVNSKQWRKILFEEMEKIINANRELIVNNTAKRIQELNAK